MPYVLVGTWFTQLLNLGITCFSDEWQKGQKLKHKILSKLGGGHYPRPYIFRRPCTEILRFIHVLPFNQKDGYLATYHWNCFKIFFATLSSDQQINIENFLMFLYNKKHILQLISFKEVSTLSGLDKNETSLD